MTAIVLSALATRRTELMKEARSLDNQLQATLAALAHLDATIQQFDPTHRAVPLTPNGNRAETTKMALTILRLAKVPMPIRDIANQIIVARGLDPNDKKVAAKITERVRVAVARQRKNGVLGSHKAEDGRVFWRVAK